MTAVTASSTLAVNPGQGPLAPVSVQGGSGQPALPDQSNNGFNYFVDHVLGGGDRFEFLGGLELNWLDLHLDIHTGFRHKHYDEFLGYRAISSDAPIARAQVTLPNSFDCQLTAHSFWEHDQQILGSDIHIPII